MDDGKELCRLLQNRLDALKEVRSRDEKRRWDAYAIMDVRTHDPLHHRHISPIKLHCMDHKKYMLTMVDGIMANLISPNCKWFKLLTRGNKGEASDTIPGANDWMEYAEGAIYQHLDGSRFYPQSRMALMDSVIGGCSFEYTGIDDTGTVSQIVHECWDPQECYISEDHLHNVDTIFREFSMTVRQCVDRWGADQLPVKLQRMVGKNDEEEVTIVHAIYPRKGLYRRNGQPYVLASKKKFASVFLCEEADGIIGEPSGYDDFPVAVHRWERNDSSVYGEGLVMQIMEDLRRFQAMNRRLSFGLDMLLNPPLAVPQALKDKFDYRPGSVNYIDPNSGEPKAVNIQLDIQGLTQELQRLTDTLKQDFNNDLFAMVASDDHQRTMFEVNKIEGRRLMLLSTIIGNIQVEKINPLVSRTLSLMISNDIMDVRTKLKATSPALVKRAVAGFDDIRIELDGLLAQNLKAYQQTTGIERGIQAHATMLQLDPSCSANLDILQTDREYMTAMGMPQDCIRELPAVNKIIAQMNENNQAQAQQQQALVQSQVMKNLSGVDLSNPNNAASAAATGGTPAQQYASGGA